MPCNGHFKNYSGGPSSRRTSVFTPLQGTPTSIVPGVMRSTRCQRSLLSLQQRVHFLLSESYFILATPSRVHSAPKSSRHGGRHSRIVTVRPRMSTSIRIWSCKSGGTRRAAYWWILSRSSSGMPAMNRKIDGSGLDVQRNGRPALRVIPHFVSPLLKLQRQWAKPPGATPRMFRGRGTQPQCGDRRSTRRPCRGSDLAPQI